MPISEVHQFISGSDVLFHSSSFTFKQNLHLEKIGLPRKMQSGMARMLELLHTNFKINVNCKKCIILV